MSADYRDNKINENALTKCNKCECLILSDSSDLENDKCVKQRRPQSAAGDTDDGEKLVFKSKCPSAVKIYVKHQNDDDSSSQEKGTSTDDNCICDDKEGRMKHICFRFYKKKKEKNNLDQEKRGSQETFKDENNQTSKPAVNDGKTQSSSMDIDDIIAKTVCNCTRCDKKNGGGGGGCNTNTIIIPRDKPNGDGVASLENFLKSEAKLNSRTMEDILNEIQKQRREILELKDMLDIVVRGLRDHLFMTTFAKTKAELFEDLYRKKSLERKTNLLSMTDQLEEMKKVENLESQKEPEKKKKRFSFPWCI